MKPTVQGTDWLEPVEEARHVFATGTTLAEIADWVLAGDHTVVRGIPSSGKTSWLRALRSEIAKREAERSTVLVNALDPAIADESSFVRRLVAELRPDRIVDPPAVETLEDLSTLIERLGLQVVLLVDNFEGLFNRGRLGGADPLAHFAPIRQLAQRAGFETKPLTVVLAGTSSIGEFSTRTGSPAFNFINHEHVLQPLDQSSTSDLWESLVKSLPDLASVGIGPEQVHEVSGGWPALIKGLASQLASDMENKRTTSFSSALFALDAVLERQWQRLDASAKELLARAARGWETPADASLKHSLRDLQRIGLLDERGHPRGSRWLRYILRSTEVATATGSHLTTLSRPARLDTAAARATQRVRRWVDSEVWLLNQLPQMVDHSESHSANVERNLLKILLHRDSCRGGYSASEVYEVASGAAWLHDIGHSGGYLAGSVVTDFRHVRKFHGYFTSQTIASHPSGFFPDVWDAYTNEPAIAAAVGLLAAHHQRPMPLS